MVDDGQHATEVPAPGSHGLYRFLEDRMFPAIISYTIHPLHISALLVLWIGLLVFHNTLFELVGGNYTNGLSAMAASIVLLQQTRQQRELRQLHRNHQALLERIHHLLHSQSSSLSSPEDPDVGEPSVQDGPSATRSE